jgi:4-hydroxy-tetrahydrodipicolinate synthase
MKKIFGVVTAVLTPVDEAGEPDVDRFQGLIQTLEKDGSDGIFVMGTTGEGASFSVKERQVALEAAIQAAGKMETIAHTGCASLKDTISLTQHAFEAGLSTVAVIPPFFYKDAPDDGLVAYYREIMAEAVPPSGKLLLYRIPQVTGLHISIDLIGRLLELDNTRLCGVKDSAGDMTYLTELCRRYPQLSVFVGGDQLILDALKVGAVGCVSGVTNVFAPMATAIFRAFQSASPQAESFQQEFTAVWEVLARYQPYTTLLKALVSLRCQDPGWLRVRPPLAPMPLHQMGSMVRELAKIDLPEAFHWIRQADLVK